MKHCAKNNHLSSIICSLLFCILIAHTITAQNNAAVQFGESSIQGLVITNTGIIHSPEFRGGSEALLEYIRNNMIYPEDALKDSVQGRVIVQFIVEKDGSISYPKIVRTFMMNPADSVKSHLFDAEAIRLISTMPRWTPGKFKGVPYRILNSIPISFKLDFANNADTLGQDIIFEDSSECLENLDFHIHPSGNLEPSEYDWQAWGNQPTDYHLIFNYEGFYSCFWQ